MIKLNIKKFIRDIPHKLKEYKRIISISQKPSKQEFLKIAKITALGALIVGFIGFSIQSIKAVIMLYV